jgi:hypothetical protein
VSLITATGGVSADERRAQEWSKMYDWSIEEARRQVMMKLHGASELSYYPDPLPNIVSNGGGLYGQA